MAIQIRELIERLQEFPSEWQIYATRQGGSLEIWEPGGARYSYVFTDERETMHFQSRRGRRNVPSQKGIE